MPKPLAFDTYEEIAQQYANQLDEKLINKYYERPATLSLLPPNLDGLKVLDIGCGPGIYAEWLVKNGADVVGVDYSPAMLTMARKRLGSTVELYQADISEPLPFLSNETFDIVLAPLVLHYVEDWSTPVREFARVLKRNGIFVLSVDHPMAAYLGGKKEDYFKTVLCNAHWPTFNVNMPFYSRSLESIIKPLVHHNFLIQAIKEPFPSEQIKTANAELYEMLNKTPAFLCIRACKNNKTNARGL